MAELAGVESGTDNFTLMRKGGQRPAGNAREKTAGGPTAVSLGLTGSRLGRRPRSIDTASTWRAPVRVSAFRTLGRLGPHCVHNCHWSQVSIRVVPRKVRLADSESSWPVTVFTPGHSGCQWQCQWGAKRTSGVPPPRGPPFKLARARDRSGSCTDWPRARAIMICQTGMQWPKSPPDERQACPGPARVTVTVTRTRGDQAASRQPAPSRRGDGHQPRPRARPGNFKPPSRGRGGFSLRLPP